MKTILHNWQYYLLFYIILIFKFLERINLPLLNHNEPKFLPIQQQMIFKSIDILERSLQDKSVRTRYTLYAYLNYLLMT